MIDKLLPVFYIPFALSSYDFSCNLLSFFVILFAVVLEQFSESRYSNKQSSPWRNNPICNWYSRPIVRVVRRFSHIHILVIALHRTLPNAFDVFRIIIVDHAHAYNN